MEKETDSEIVIYTAEDDKTKIEVKLEDETVWLNQKQMADLFQKDKSTISRHIDNIFEEGELNRKSTVAKYATVQNEGDRTITREIDYYNLDVIISVGYRVKSHRGTQFRIWATQQLRELIVKGFVMDDDRLKNPSDTDYFDELIERVRDIRTSERRFYQKITDIYATSVDYDSRAELTQEFFATVQNKMHWAIHGHTAQEVIVERADRNKPNMGLTSYEGDKIRQSDVTVAKNYLSQDELEQLKLIVDQYLSFAEFQARQKKPMYMKDWIRKLDDFIHLNEMDILRDAGRISKKIGEQKAINEYKAFKKIQDKNFVSDFDKATAKYLEVKPKPKKKAKSKGKKK